MVFGNLYDENNNPIVVAVRINSTNRRNKISLVNKIRSIGTRSHNIDKLLDEEAILYLSKNRKETETWFNALGRSTPFGGTKFGLIKTISDQAPKSNRIFSMKDTSPADIDQLRAENESLRQANEILKEQFKLTSGRKVSRKVLDRMAGRILKGYQSKYDRKTLVDNLEALFDEIHKAGDDPAQWEAVEAASVGLAKAVIE